MNIKAALTYVAIGVAIIVAATYINNQIDKKSLKASGSTSEEETK
jgi:hypothetical protein